MIVYERPVVGNLCYTSLHIYEWLAHTETNALHESFMNVTLDRFHGRIHVLNDRLWRNHELYVIVYKTLVFFLNACQVDQYMDFYDAFRGRW